MSQALHLLEICAVDLVRCCLRHLWCRTPVILSGEEVNRAFLDVDLVHPVPSVKPAKVEIEVTVEDA